MTGLAHIQAAAGLGVRLREHTWLFVRLAVKEPECARRQGGNVLTTQGKNPLARSTGGAWGPRDGCSMEYNEAGCGRVGSEGKDPAMKPD